MAKAEVGKKTNVRTKTEEGSNLKGTLISVFVVGLVLAVFWIGVYSLYLDRM